MNVCMITLGCPKNLVDSEKILGGLQNYQCCIVEQPHKADVIVINSCGFIEDAKKESIETILNAIALKKQGLCQYVFLTGCLAQRYFAELQKEIPEMDGIWGVRNIEKIAAEMAQKLKMNQTVTKTTGRMVTTKPGYAYIKIAEGCDRSCSFCIIPAIRGSYHSRNENDILAEAQQLIDRGINEIILISQDTTYYGHDLKNGQSLVTLLPKLDQISKKNWIRLLYLYPDLITDELMQVIADSEAICPYIDVPIQHISDPVLQRMKRGTKRKKIEYLIDKLRCCIPNAALRTSVIVGFPGETDADFEDLVEFIEEIKFERLGIFQYSEEEGTVAANLPNQIADEVKAERYSTLMEIQKDISLANNQKRIGKKLNVLVESNGNGKATGRTIWDAPDIDQNVYLNSNVSPGTFAAVIINYATEYDLYGSLT